MIGRPGAKAVVGVEVHGVVLLLPGHLLKCHGRLVGGEYGRMEGQAPIYAQPDKTNKVKVRCCENRLATPFLDQPVLNSTMLSVVCLSVNQLEMNETLQNSHNVPWS